MRSSSTGKRQPWKTACIEYSKEESEERNKEEDEYHSPMQEEALNLRQANSVFVHDGDCFYIV